MRTFSCACGSAIYFENSLCVTCGKDLGWCPACQAMTGLLPMGGGRHQCGHGECGASLIKCHNYAVEKVCNRCTTAPANSKGQSPLCDYCRFNDTIPDLTIPGNRELWGRLETAKRRLLYTLDLVKLPYGSKENKFDPPLSFDFKADVAQPRRLWWSMGKEEQVYTGHADGKITINLREADTVELEKTRVMFQEAHRTVIGHFRHEIAHYYWQMLVQNRCDADFKATFGDQESRSYADAQQSYYQLGPPVGWQSKYVTAYAAMHPWEDFAETFATYLDMVSVLDTASHMGIIGTVDPTSSELPAMVASYIRLGVVLNEMNRAMGLLDLVPEILVPPVVDKMRFVHDLVQANRNA